MMKSARKRILPIVLVFACLMAFCFAALGAAEIIGSNTSSEVKEESSISNTEGEASKPEGASSAADKTINDGSSEASKESRNSGVAIAPMSAAGAYVVTLDGAQVGAAQSTLQAAVNLCTGTGAYTITLNADDPAIGAVVTIPASKNITLTSGEGGPYTISATHFVNAFTASHSVLGDAKTPATNGRHIVVGNSSTLTLNNITISGAGFAPTSVALSKRYNGGIHLAGSNSKLVMEEGSVITKCYYGLGGGVRAAGSGSNITMAGGIITGNEAQIYGGGVYLGNATTSTNTTTMTMSSGEISGNKVAYGGNSDGEVPFAGTFNGYHYIGYTAGGGVFADPSAVITMTGGVIKDNSADNAKATVSMSREEFEYISYGAVGAGVALFNGGKLNMSGGYITGNTTLGFGGGVGLLGGNGIPEINMTGGYISENEAWGGGGIFSDGGHVVIDGSAEISANDLIFNSSERFAVPSRYHGGGILIESYFCWAANGSNASTAVSGSRKLEIKGGKIINHDISYRENKEFQRGSAIFANNINSPFFTNYKIDMSGGEISGNSGGSTVKVTGQYSMTGGVIKNNHGNSVGGIDIKSNGSALTIDGGEVIHNTGKIGGVFADALTKFYLISGKVSYNTTGYFVEGLYYDIGDVGGVEVKGTMIMSGGEVSYNTGKPLVYEDGEVCSPSMAAGIYLNGSRGAAIAAVLQITGGTIANNVNEYGDIYQNYDIEYPGGGVAAKGKSTITMSGGTITENETRAGGGGGISMQQWTADAALTFTMTGGTISKNKACSGGGGVFANTNVKVNLTGGTITENIVVGETDENMEVYGKENFGGGGVCLSGGSTLTMSSGNALITENEVLKGDGGGVYLSSDSTMTMSSATSSITNNEALKGDGGGIFTNDYSYSNPADLTKYKNITLTAGAISGNTSRQKYQPPINQASFTARAANANKFEGTLLNNHQINYTGPYVITYYTNGGSNNSAGHNYYYQSVPGEETGFDPGSAVGTIVTYATTGFGAPSGMVFVHWNTKADGTGTTYLPGETETVTDSSLKLYAIYRKPPLHTLTVSKTVTSDGTVDTAKEFTFKVKILDASNNKLAAGYVFTTSQGDKALSSDSELEFTLKHGEVITIANITQGWKYVVTESTYSDYETSHVIGSGAKQESSSTNLGVAAAVTGSIEVKFTNHEVVTVNKYSVKISKTVLGAGADVGTSFNFTVRIKDSAGAALAAADRTFSLDGGGSITLNDNGEATFTLKHNESKTILGVIEGYKVKVTETRVTGYTPSYSRDNAAFVNNANTTPEMEINSNTTVAFKNTKGSIPKVGIILDVWPYLLMVAVVAVAAVGFVVKKVKKSKRSHRNDDDGFDGL